MRLRYKGWLASIFLLITGCKKSTPSPVMGTTSEAVLRRQVLEDVLPSFPEDAVHSHRAGVAVAEIQLDDDGNVATVQILESPTPSVSQAVSRAITQWHFKPYLLNNGQQVLLSGLLTFYFEFRKGQPLVLNPADAGYVGRWPIQKLEGIGKAVPSEISTEE